VAKLADALDLGSSVRKDVWVQVPPSAQKAKDSRTSESFSIWDRLQALLHQNHTKPTVELVAHSR
jgi:hypothetical protein